MALCEFTNQNFNPSENLGLRTEQFVKFYFKHPRRVFKWMDDNYIASEKYKSDMYDVRFIHTERLNVELYDFLLQMNYKHEDISFILNMGKILPEGKRRSAEQKWEKYYTPKLKQFVRKKERMLFKMFAEYDEPQTHAPHILAKSAKRGL